MSETAKKVRSGAQGARKVKTGCLTCKIRHKKCNEARPACLQCVSTGRKCDFLAEKHLIQNPQSFGPVQHNTQASRDWIGSIPRVLRTVPLKSVEASHFEYFRLVCTKDFSRFFEANLWGQVFLRAAHSERCIMHAIVAIAALSRSQNEKLLLREGSHSLESYSSFSLHHYNLAVRELNKRLDKSDQSWELAITGSLAFTAIEILQGNDKGMLMHLRQAFAILKSPPTPAIKSDSEYLFNAFSRIDIQGTAFTSFHAIMPVNPRILPADFRDLEGARESLNVIVASMHSLFRRGTSETRRLPYSPLSPGLARDLSNLENLFSRWKYRFESLISSQMTEVDMMTMASINILKIHHLVAEIRIATHFYRNELIYDSQIPRFRRAVDFATLAMEADDTAPTPIRSKLCNIIDIGIVQPLYFVGRKCRDGLLRRKAIEVLEKVRKEWVLDVKLLIAVLRWITAVEEEGVKDSDGVVPERSRLTDIELDFYDVARPCKIVAQRKGEDGSVEKISMLICVE